MSQLQILERIRALEADIERAVESIAQQELFSNNVISLNEQHRILVDHFKIAEARKVNLVASKLLDIYLDEDEIEEAQQLPTSSDALPNAIKSFEARIADIREYHVNHRDLPQIKYSLDEPEANKLENIFNSRERYGMCLDLEGHYTHYSTFVTTTNTMAKESLSINNSHLSGDDELQLEFASKSIGWMPRMEYFEFISELPQLLLEKIYASEKVLGFQLYANFVEPLYEYLVDFYQRIYPLSSQDLNKLERDTESLFAEYWTVLNEHKHSIVVSESSSSRRAVKFDTKNNNNALVAISKEEENDVNDNNDGANSMNSKYNRDYHRALSHGGMSVSGLVIPAPLKRFRKEFAMWPLGYVESVILPLANSETYNNNSKVANSKAIVTTGKPSSSHAMSKDSEHHRDNNNESKSKGHKDTNFTLETQRTQLPRSINEVKHICLVESKVIALLRSLLFKPLQQTSQTLLRDCARTVEEVEHDRARAAKEFARSLERVHANVSLSSMESTLARAAKYQMEHNMHENEDNFDKNGDKVDNNYPNNNVTAGIHTTNSEYDRNVDGNNISSNTNEETNAHKAREEVIGDDGKPIARWLVKLQQLDKNFLCEVCGGTVYKGPKVFREHFGAERHTEGLRRLGVTQHLKEYEGISAIRLVIEMRDRLQRNQSEFYKRLRDDEDNEEMQDAQGKVITTREYRRLQQRRN